MIQCFSRKQEQQVLEQDLCPVSLSFILALGLLWSFLLSHCLLPHFYLFQIVTILPKAFLGKGVGCIFKKMFTAQLVWLSGLGAGLQTKGCHFDSRLGHMPGLQARFPGFSHMLMFLSQSFSLPSTLSEVKSLKNMFTNISPGQVTSPGPCIVVKVLLLATKLHGKGAGKKEHPSPKGKGVK